MNEISPSQRRSLRAKAHHLHPVVTVGQHGLTPAVLHEIDVALTAHELVKIRVFVDDRAQRESLLVQICADLACAPVQHLGKLLIVWRPSEAGAEQYDRAAREPRKPRALHAKAAPDRAKAGPRAVGAPARQSRGQDHGATSDLPRRRRLHTKATDAAAGQSRDEQRKGKAAGGSASRRQAHEAADARKRGSRRGPDAGAPGASAHDARPPRRIGSTAGTRSAQPERRPPPNIVATAHAQGSADTKARAPRGVPGSGMRRRRRSG